MVALLAGGHSSLSVLADGTVRAWSQNSSGQPGNGSKNSSTPVSISGVAQPLTILTGTRSSKCKGVAPHPCLWG
ncbi:hypothetical protein [Deinococcus hopiensis]|uniref:Regulator of chromosome condensation (RCC1) repeat-containing protein n=1 Tax=Deinococcus hopiensis KR-140 TaxID=695939 RepID=A0A1W1URQ2_9DEIO|nr:hypothetical protein [Deinococcus hopiensis]SMB83808.1 Regulator of chromosome condensation (RCC1) repeat-containing protein [Deinococcus hopiensis KR-140]